jgi:hypothetical protein
MAAFTVPDMGMQSLRSNSQQPSVELTFVSLSMQSFVAIIRIDHCFWSGRNYERRTSWVLVAVKLDQDEVWPSVQIAY